MVIIVNIYLLKEYINRLRREEVVNFALKQGITLDDNEVDVIYNHIKKDYKTFIYGNPRVILDEIKKEVKPLTYSKIETLYEQFKHYLP